jgi:hypothetical protein
MALEVLVSSRLDTNPVRIYKSIDTDLVQIGGDITRSGTGVLETVVESQGITRNTTANIWGKIWAIVPHGLWRYDPAVPTNDWIEIINIPSWAVGTQKLAAIDYLVQDNVPYVVGILQNQNSSSTVFSWNLLTDSLNSTASLPFGSNGNIRGQCFTNGKFHFVQANASFYTVDPLAETSSFVSLTEPLESTGSNEMAASCVFNNKIYMLQNANNGNDIHLSTLNVGTMFNFLVVDTPNGPQSGYAGGSLLFSDGAAMFAIYWAPDAPLGIPGGWKCRQLDPQADAIVNGSDLTNVVIPAALRSGGVADQADQWRSVITHNDDGSPKINIWHTSGSGTVTLFEWVDSATVMTQVSTSGDIINTHNMPHDQNGGGTRVYVPGAPEIAIYAKEPVAGGERLTFRCFGGAVGQTVRFYFGTGGTAPETQVSLIGSATGGSAFRNGNQVDNVDCDGTTDYTAIVQALGFNRLDLIEIVGRVSAT